MAIKLDKRSVKKLTQQYVEELKKENKIKKLLVQDDKYFSWLTNFTKNNNGKFSDDQWAYSSNKISETDKKNVEKLSLFYEALSEHAKKHNIVEEKDKDFYGGSLLVRFHNENYKIGYLSGQGTFFYCEKVERELKTRDIIDFNYVLNENTEELIH